MDPYLLLNLTEEADDAAVKTAYLAATREYPPERDPDMFEAIRAAYESIATERQRLNYHLFQLTPVDPLTLLYSCLEGHAPPTVSDQSLRQTLMESTHSFIQQRLSKL